MKMLTRRTQQRFFSQGQNISYKAVLTHDPIGNLPKSFTICATMMITSIFQNDQFSFFSVLAADSDHTLIPTRLEIIKTSEGIETRYNSYRHWKELEGDGKELHAFSHQWIKRCGSYNLVSGLYQVVIDGVLVVNVTVPSKSLEQWPTDLSGKLVIGSYYSPGGHWRAAKNKVTNVNIYSEAHSVEAMRQNTLGGECSEEGDYLAWRDMKWTFYGEAVIDTINAEEPCLGDPDMIIFDGSMNHLKCMQLCENIGARAPSILTVEEWLRVKRFVGRYDGFVVWVAISDEEKEEEWRDHYTGKIMNHSEAWFPWA